MSPRGDLGRHSVGRESGRRREGSTGLTAAVVNETVCAGQTAAQHC